MALRSKPSGCAFSGDLIVPVILGEYGVNTATQTSSRLFWLENGPFSSLGAAISLGLSPGWLLNGALDDRWGQGH
jgi:hypothetical protein